MTLPGVGTPPAESAAAHDELAARYPMQVNLLLNMVRLSRLGGIATIECDSPALRQRLFAYFERRLLEQRLYLYPVEVSRDDLNLVRVLRDLTDRAGFKELELAERYAGIVLFVYGIEQYTPAQQEKFLQFLNLFRDGTTIIKQPIVLWASRDFMATMAREAPDFWSWKGLTLCFDTEPGEEPPEPTLAPLQRYLQSVVEDPDFAVWRDLFVPLRGSIVQPEEGPPEGEALPEHWQGARFPGRRLQGEASEAAGWARVRTSDLLELVVARSDLRSVILGEAGVGKTTVLRYLTWVHARYALTHSQEEGNPLIPVFVRLHHLRRNRTIEALIWEALGLNGLHELPDPEALAALLYDFPDRAPWGHAAPRFLLLLDGLNEVAPARLPGLQHFVERLHVRHAVILSCRIEAYLPLDGVQTLLIESLDTRDMERFALRTLGEQRGRQFVAELVPERRLMEMARTPLTLFMLAQVSHDGPSNEALPRNRGRLLQRFTERLLRRTETEWWRIYGRSQSKVAVEVSREALTQLGLTMQRERLAAMPRERAYWLIREAVYGIEVKASASDILEGLLYSGLIRLSADREGVEFIHQAVREYFAALRLSEEPALLGQELHSDALDEWTGTLLLLFGLSERRASLFREIVRDGQEYARLWLAAECLATVREEDAGWEGLLAQLGGAGRERAIFQTVVGLAYEGLGEAERALQAFGEAVSADDTYLFAFYDLAIVFRQLREPQHAIASLRRCIALVPEFVDAYNQLGITYYEVGDLARALLVFEATVALEPENGSHHYNVGFVHKSLNQYWQAQQAFARALSFQPESVEARTQLALIEEAQRHGLLDLLHKVLLFRSLPLEHRIMIVQRLTPRHYEPGEVVVSQGEVGDELYIIQDGEVEVMTADGRGSPIVVNHLGPGDHFGEIALLDESPRRTATVVALTPVRLLSLQRQTFNELQTHFPDVAESLVQTSYERLHRDIRLALDASAERNRQLRLLQALTHGGVAPVAHRLVTVLVADSHEAATLAQRLGASQALGCLRDWYLQAIDLVGAEGLVRQAAGGRVLALFENPVVAVRVAVALRQAFAHLWARWAEHYPLELDARLAVGLSTGPLPPDNVNPIAPLSATAPTAVATRLCQAALAEGVILLDEPTGSSVATFLPLTPIPLSPPHEPVYRLS